MKPRRTPAAAAQRVQSDVVNPKLKYAAAGTHGYMAHLEPFSIRQKPFRDARHVDTVLAEVRGARIPQTPHSSQRARARPCVSASEPRCALLGGVVRRGRCRSRWTG